MKGGKVESGYSYRRDEPEERSLCQRDEPEGVDEWWGWGFGRPKLDCLSLAEWIISMDSLAMSKM